MALLQLRSALRSKAEDWCQHAFEVLALFSNIDSTVFLHIPQKVMTKLMSVPTRMTQRSLIQCIRTCRYAVSYLCFTLGMKTGFLLTSMPEIVSTAAQAPSLHLSGQGKRRSRSLDCISCCSIGLMAIICWICSRDSDENYETWLKRTCIIWSTLVGATRRIHAMIASESLSMVVEEVCEV